MLALFLTLALGAAQPPERIVDVRVQGNTLTQEADVVALTGVRRDDVVTPTLTADVTSRLRASGKFRSVEVLKRYASIADPTQVLLVVIVDEGRVTVQVDERAGTARTVRRRGPPLMFLPLLGSEDGYGFTYGALLSVPNVAGPRTRLSMPLTWGGERRAGLEYEKRLSSARATRVLVGGSILRRESDAIGAVDRREQGWVRGEREIARALRLGAWTGLDAVAFKGENDTVGRLGADATLDTRVDPMLSRNAVYVRSAVEWLGVRGTSNAVRTLLDANAYLPGPGPSTFAVRAYRDGANVAVPAYLKVLRGRDGTLLGYRAGTAAGDSTAAGTIEFRMPVTSPLDIGKFGVRAFVDAATVYDAGQALRRQHFERSVGGGVWFTATVIRLALDVAHGSSGSTRVQVSSGLLF
ncbi:MAG: BamA/TamA family outer membrane protein [Vicinamibacterales bacterium]